MRKGLSVWGLLRMKQAEPHNLPMPLTPATGVQQRRLCGPAASRAQQHYRGALFPTLLLQPQLPGGCHSATQQVVGGTWRVRVWAKMDWHPAWQARVTTAASQSGSGPRGDFTRWLADLGYHVVKMGGLSGGRKAHGPPEYQDGGGSAPLPGTGVPLHHPDPSAPPFTPCVVIADSTWASSVAADAGRKLEFPDRPIQDHQFFDMQQYHETQMECATTHRHHDCSCSTNLTYWLTDA